MKKVIIMATVLALVFGGCVSAEPEIDPNLVTIEIISSSDKSVTFELKNNSRGGISFGEDYYIEFLEGKTWVPLDEKNEGFFAMTAYGLEPGGIHNFSVNFEERYGALPNGTYRVAKDVTLLNEDGIPCGNQRTFAEFEIKQDGKMK